MSQPLPPHPLGNPPLVVAAEPMVAAPVPAGPAPLAVETQVRALFAQGKNGAHWFYWVAALSLVNSAVALGGGNFHFVIGLGATWLVDAIAAELARQAPDAALVLKGIAFAFALIVAAIVALFGWLSSKRFTIAQACGMFLYLLDGLLYLLIGDLMSIAFHAFALFQMWRGLQAHRQLAALEEQLASPQASAEFAAAQ